ncbi:MAG: hypothetical protein AAGA03_03895 [Planctomycetota bacterium]
MGLKDPIAAYIAEGNAEAHAIVNWLTFHGVKAHAVEDHSGAGQSAFGLVNQFHQPKVFVQRADKQQAAKLLAQFEENKRAKLRELEDAPSISSECEDCGAFSEFPASQDGTTQNCPKCNAFMDVGTFDWPDDVDLGEPET